MAKRKYLGEINLLGLNDMGNNPGMKAGYGAAIGAGSTVLATLAFSQSAAQAPKKEMYGLLTGLAASGVLYAMKSTRHAALYSALGAIGVAAATWIARTVGLIGPATITPTSTIKGMGIPSVRYLNGLGIPQVNYLNGPGMGIATIQNQPRATGAIPGVAGPSFAGSRLGDGAPVSLLGPATAQGDKISLMGGPSVHGLSSHYGATLLGGGR